MKFLQMFGGMLTCFLILDGIWLMYVTKNIYQKWIGYLLTDNVVWGAVFSFYILYILGVSYFAVFPSNSIKEAAFKGVLLGGLCYTTYDLTNWATIKNWPWQIIFPDIAWGIFVTATCAAIGYLLYNA